MRISSKSMPAGTPPTRKRGRTQLSGIIAPGLPLAPSCGSSTHRPPAVKLSAAPNSVGAFAGTPSPMIGASSKSKQVPAPHSAWVMFGLPGSASGGAPPPLLVLPGMNPLPPLEGMKTEPPPPEEFEPLPFAADPPGRPIALPPPLVPQPTAIAPIAPVKTARPRYFRIVNTPNQQRPKKRNKLAL